MRNARHSPTPATGAPDPMAEAVRHFQAGRPAEAERALRGLLARQPEHPGALGLMGALALQGGKPQAAEQFLRQSLAHAPGNAVTHMNLGNALSAQGRRDEGLAAFREAVRLAPGNADVQLNLGIALLNAGRADDALKPLRKAARKLAGNPMAQMNLGIAEARAGDGRASLQAFRRAEKLAPDHPGVLVNHALALSEHGKAGDAVTRLDKALARSPGNRDLLYMLAQVYRRAEDGWNELQALKRVVEVDPSYAPAHVNLGLLQSERGRLDEAEHHAREAVRLGPNEVEPLLNLVDILHGTGRMDDAEHLLRDRLETCPAHARGRLLCRLAALRQSAGAFDEARPLLAKARAAGDPEFDTFLHLTADQGLEAGDLDEAAAEVADGLDTRPLDDRKRARLLFALADHALRGGDPDAAFGYLERANALSDARFRETPKDLTDLTDALIETFAAGGFDAFAGFGDDTDVPVFVVGLPRSGTTLVEQIIAAHPAANGAGELTNISVTATELQARHGCASPYPGAVREITAKQSRILAREYLAAIEPLMRTAKRVVDKMPANYFHLGLIAVLFPNARVIHCRRDPVDTCLSMYQRHFAGRQPYAYSQEKLAHLYREYDRLMAHWKAVLPLPIHDVVYEEMVADPETQARRLVEACGLSWDARCLAFQNAANPVRTASSWQVRQPIYRTAVKRWKAYEGYLQPLIRSLGEHADTETS